ncbi:MAG: glycosyltransferase family 4 protein [Chloroflexi bacterium]|nr:glycosyltransferase family 4 protein [Chloroflexota bacterium]
MSKLLYISLMRLPTEKAHGGQIMQNCEAFAAAGCQVTLWAARRWNTRAMRKISDPYAWYGVEANFRIRRVPCIDLFPLFPAESAASRIAFYVQALSYALACAVMLLFTRADIYYSRDELLVRLLGWLKPRRNIAYEAHLYPRSGRSANLQGRATSSAGNVIAITEPLRRDLIAHRRASPQQCISAHDGISRARFVDLPTQPAARQAIGWHEHAFIVGYVGRLQMIGMDKGVASLVEALAAVPGAYLARVGGPVDMAESLRESWIALGLPRERFFYAGQMPPPAVPDYLRAFDVCAMPHPATKQFANYTSPLKLFEYMAAGRAIVASDLPSWADVLTHEETALLLPPGDSAAWSHAIVRLRDDPALRGRLGAAAREKALAHYTWAARAERILAHIRRND